MINSISNRVNLQGLETERNSGRPKRKSNAVTSCTTTTTTPGVIVPASYGAKAYQPASTGKGVVIEPAAPQQQQQQQQSQSYNVPPVTQGKW